MSIDLIRERHPEREFRFYTSRSSGPGGQNVNKVNTKVEIRFNVISSSVLSEPEKERIISKLKKRISSEGDLIVISRSGRSQFRNRADAVEKMLQLLSSAIEEDPERISTTPTKSSVIERLTKKRHRGGIKKLRHDPGSSEDL